MGSLPVLGTQRWTRPSTALEDPMDTRTTAHRPRAGGVGSQGWGGVVEPEGPLSRHGVISGQASWGRRLLHLLLMNERERLAKMRVGEGKGFRKRNAHVQRPKKRVLCLWREVTVP